MSDATAIAKIQKQIRAANYLSVAQIYLRDNFLLERPLQSEDVKPKLVGHWGTCPGVNFVYAHLNHLVKKHNQSTIFILGPGHGQSGLQANLLMEGTLEQYYPKATQTAEGIAYIGKQYTWPYGFTSHVSPEVPGAILEGGELGYSLSSAFGAVMDNPDLLAACLIGDGEAETGAIAAAWHLNKLMDPATNGAVLPILHVNGYKISGPTIFGRMNNQELTDLFSGYGYEPFFVEGEDLDQQMFDTLETCQQRIKAIQTAARSKKPPVRPRFPMIVMRTPKGMTTVKELRGQKIEGTILAHQVVMPTVRTDDEELAHLEAWLKTYHFEELFDTQTGFSQDILDNIPPKDLLIGNNPHVFGKTYKPLILPKATALAKKVSAPGQDIQSNAMRMAGVYLKEVFALNGATNNVRLMSPDETYSNRLDNVFEVTGRGWVWPHDANDKDITRDGKVMEMLSEHNMHGLSQGYLLTGRHAALTTYEAFAQIFGSMAHTYQKFLKYVIRMPWRLDLPSFNYLLTSTVWRQERDGYSHQNPGFISGLLEKHSSFIKLYFPVDDNSMLATLEETFASRNGMNVITAGKTPEPRWLSLDQAREALKDGLSVWDFASDKNPHIVLVGIGDYMTKELLAAIELIKSDAPEIRLRLVNILRLQCKSGLLEPSRAQIPNAEKYFTIDKPVIVNFHGYPDAMKSVLFDVKNPERFSVHGYMEEGGTTTPFDLLTHSQVDRYHLAIEIATKAYAQGVIDEKTCGILQEKYVKALADHKQYIIENGADPQSIESWSYNAPATSDNTADIQHSTILQQAHTIAFIGLSDKPERYSYKVAKYFQDKGYRVVPINPNIDKVLGEKAYNSLLEIPQSVHIDIVDIFRNPEDVIPHMHEIIERGGIRTVWLAEGANSPAAEEFAEDYGLQMVTNQCIMKVDIKETSSQ